MESDGDHWTNLKVDVRNNWGVCVAGTFHQCIPKLEPDTAGKSPRVFHTQHQCKKWEMIQEGQTGVEPCLHRNDQHPGRGEGEVKDNDGRKKEEKDSEQYSAQQELIEVVIA